MQIVIYDFGSQFTHLILRNIRHLGVYCSIESPDSKNLKEYSPSGIILSGGPRSITKHEIKFVQALLKHFPSTPILGICYGMQLLATIHNHKVKSQKQCEYGPEFIVLKRTHPLFDHISKRQLRVWMSHGDHVELTQAAGGTPLAKSSSGTLAAVEFTPQVLGVQFHPEVSHTDFGTQILKNFVFEIAGAKKDWSSKQIFDDVEKIIQEKIIQPQRKVLCAVSGGVDSSVLAKMLQKKCPKQVKFIHVDHGLGRHEESKNVVKHLNHVGIPVQLACEQERFVSSLSGITDPEQKRKIIGTQFIRVFEEYAAHDDIDYLVQGTLYPDKIESTSQVGQSSVIKTHHNVGGVPQDCKLQIIEPFCHLYKDDVRLLGKTLGLPKDITMRHPFPGPGLAIRILGEVTPEKLDLLRQCDRILIEYLKDKKLYDKIWQAGCIFLPVKSVGVKGDQRAYQPVVAIRCVVSENAMTAHAARVSVDNLEACATTMLNRVPGIGRVVYDISPKPPATIEWE